MLPDWPSVGCIQQKWQRREQLGVIPDRRSLWRFYDLLYVLKGGVGDAASRQYLGIRRVCVHQCDCGYCPRCIGVFSSTLNSCLSLTPVGVFRLWASGSTDWGRSVVGVFPFPGDTLVLLFQHPEKCLARYFTTLKSTFRGILMSCKHLFRSI